MEEPVTQGEETLWIPPSALWQTDFLRFFSTRKTAGSPRQKIAGTIRSPPRLCAQPGAREEDREPKPASQF